MTETRWVSVGIAAHLVTVGWTAAMALADRALRWRPRDHGRQSLQGW